jgi:cell division protein FtsB
MKKVKNLLLRIYHVKALKYILVTLFAVVLVGFVDENSVWKHLRNKQRINELQEEIDRYTEQHKRDNAQIDMLNNDPKAIQKIARERYFMKADNEDIFVLSDDDQTFSFADGDENAE